MRFHPGAILLREIPTLLAEADKALLMRDLERVPGVGSAAMFTRDASLEL